MDGKGWEPDKHVGNLVGVIALVEAEGRHLPLTYNTQNSIQHAACGVRLLALVVPEGRQ
jgi:hypothetical protein